MGTADKSMSLKIGLDVMTGILLKVLGELVHQTARDQEAGMWFQLRMSASPDLRTNLNRYLKDYNAENKTKFSASFPKPFRMILREGSQRPEGTARRGAKGRGRNQDPQR